jgi:hypothetical protein
MTWQIREAAFAFTSEPLVNLLPICELIWLVAIRRSSIIDRSTNLRTASLRAEEDRKTFARKPLCRPLFHDTLELCCLSCLVFTHQGKAKVPAIRVPQSSPVFRAHRIHATFPVFQPVFLRGNRKRYRSAPANWNPAISARNRTLTGFRQRRPPGRRT